MEKNMNKNKSTHEEVTFSPIQLQQYRSPEKLNEYVRIATPAAWVAVVALALIVVALFIWGFTGTLPAHYVTTGVCTGKDGSRDVDAVVCLVDPVKASSRDLEEKDATVVLRSGQRFQGKTTLLDPFPLSREEILENLAGYGLGNEWIISQMEQYPFMYFLIVTLDSQLGSSYYGELAEVSVITSEVRPYKFLLGGVS